MENNYFENYNIELINAIPSRLKPAFKQLITLMNNSPYLYTKAQIEKLLKDLKSEKLIFKIEKVSYSQNNVANSLDRSAFGYGFVDFGKDDILYGKPAKNKIVIWEEILRY